MSVYQTTLRVFSIITIVMGSVVLLAGAIVLIAAFATGTNATSQVEIAQNLAQRGLEDVNGSEVAYEVASMGLTVLLFGGYFLATGIFGLLGAKNPDLTLPVIILAICGLTLSSLNFVGGFLSGTYTMPGSGSISFTTALANIAIMSFLMVLAMIVRAQGKQGIGLEIASKTKTKTKTKKH